MKQTKIVKVHNREDIAKIREIENEHGWKMVSYTFLNNAYEIEFIHVSNERFNNLSSLIYFISLVCIIGFGGVFGSGFTIGLFYYIFKLDQLLFILFLCLLVIGFVQFILSVIGFVFYIKHYPSKAFLILGIFITLTGNVFYGPILIMYSNKLKEQTLKKE